MVEFVAGYQYYLVVVTEVPNKREQWECLFLWDWGEKNIWGRETWNAEVLVFLENQLDQQGNILVSMVIFFHRPEF